MTAKNIILVNIIAFKVILLLIDASTFYLKFWFITVLCLINFYFICRYQNKRNFKLFKNIQESLTLFSLKQGFLIIQKIIKLM